MAKAVNFSFTFWHMDYIQMYNIYSCYYELQNNCEKKNLF